MTFKIYSNGEYLDISTMVINPSCNIALSMDLEKPIGESTMNLQIYDGFITVDETSVRFKPEEKQRIQWYSDDGDNTKLFDGVITSAVPSLAGFVSTDEGWKQLLYDVEVAGASELLKDKKISGTFTSFVAGTLIDQLCAVADSRITFDLSNDAGYTVGSLELPEMSYYDAIQELAKSSGLMVWIDENWVCHHKLYSTISGLANDTAFDVTDVATKTYFNFKPKDSIEEVVTRVHVVGSTMDAGTKNTQNRKQGKQKREENIYTKTATLAQINEIRSRMQFSDLAAGTDPETLTVNTPGIIEKTINAQEVYLEADLALIAEVELLRFADPKMSGSVSYYDKGVVPGKSIVLNSSIYDISTVVPVIEVEISSEGGGFNTSGEREYIYTAHFNGPSTISKIKKNLQPLPAKKVKAEMLIKPAPPTVIGHTSTEVSNSLGSWELSGEVRCNYDAS